ncbi:MAG: DUF2723 domain-containing protein [Chitinophagaceae bacterium]
MNFKKVNNITGWVIFLIAMATYFLTREARGSLWDTGEFIASAKGLQLPHPPGAPLFVLLGRFFIILFGDNGHTAASAVNFMSALASAATILFLFWSITHFARKMFVGVGEALDKNQLFTTMAAGVVGALAYTFSDSFWFSAVEGEVYALSSFFTALVFWVMLKWEHADEKAGTDQHAKARSDRWIVFFFFMMGLSIGVHLLNLLCIPAAVMIYYYRRYAVTTKGSIWAFVIGCLVTGVVQLGVIQYSMKAAGIFDVIFVNKLGMPFFSGFAIYFLALAALIIWALSFKENNTTKPKIIIFFVLFLALSMLPFIISIGAGGFKIMKFLLIGIIAGLGYFLKPGAVKILKLSLWCYAFIMLGYFMYFTTMIRSNANPSVDMNNVDNPINLVYYLSREQYGEAPLIYGPHFAANPPDDLVEEKPLNEGEMVYVKGDKKYIPIGRKQSYNYKSDVKQLFPRVWDSSNDQFHADFYAEWLNLAQDQQTGRFEAPTYSDNVNWFFTYQMGLMYWRYFMWNFSGRQNDLQGLGNKRDGNWISGISFIDNKRLGDQSQLPDSIKHNKATNKLYLLPFILGIIGCVYQFIRNRKDWIVSFLLFFFTGLAVVIYLNSPGNQPRERDYAFVGSFYAFALWIGLSVVALVRLAKEKADQLTFQNTLIYGGILTFIVTMMSSMPGTFGDALMTGIYVTALFAIVTSAATFILRSISSDGKNAKVLNIATAAFCIITPLLMAQQVWDDHDRSNKTTAPDIAKDYLESCAPNAIIFTFGDNDTYPLWYAQEVEGVRKDIRVINNSLLGIDWYINQLRYKVNDADSVDVLWTPEQIEGHNREYLRYRQQGDPNQFYDLYEVMKTVLGKVNLDPETGRDVGFGSFPVSKFKVPVNIELAKKYGVVNATDSVVSELRFEIPQSKLNSGIARNDLIIFNIIASNAANGWKRPIYFTAPIGELGFSQYIRKDGLSYRLVPVLNKYPQQNWITDQALRQLRIGGTQIRDNNSDFMLNTLLTKFEFGGANKKDVYFDEENRRHMLNLRALFGEAAGNLADAGRLDDAKKLIDKAEAGINPENLPYGMTSRYNSHNQTGLIYLEACYKSGKTELAEKVRLAIRKDLEQQQKYYNYIRDSRQEYFGGFERSEAPINEAMLMVLDAVEKKYAPQTQPKTTEGTPTIDNTKPDSLKGNTPNKQP